jgi:O-antigen/teichoic acid export membrane protein
MNHRLMIILSTFARISCTILSGIILSRGYSKADFGTFMQGALWISTITEVASIGMPKAVLYFSHHENNQRNAIYHCLLLVAVISGLAGLMTWPAWPVISRIFSNPQLETMLVWVALVLPFKVMSTVLSNALLIVGRIGWMTFVTAAISPLILVVFGLCTYYGFQIKTLFIAQFCIEFCQFILFFSIFMTSPSTGSWKWDYPLIRKILLYCSPLVLTIVTLMTGKRLDSFLIAGYFDPSVYAIYTRGALELPFSQLILFNVSALMMPRIASLYRNQNIDGVKDLLKNEIGKNALLLFPAFFGILLVYKEFIVFLYSQEYAASSSVFLIYLLLIPIQLYAFDTVIQAMNKSIWVAGTAAISIGVNIMVTIGLISHLGPLAPAVGMFCSIASNVLLIVFIIGRYLGSPPSKWIPWATLGKLFLLSGAPMIAAAICKHYFSGPLAFRLFFYPTAYYAIVFALFWKAGVLPMDRIAALLPWGKKHS